MSVQAKAVPSIGRKRKFNEAVLVWLQAVREDRSQYVAVVVIARDLIQAIPPGGQQLMQIPVTGFQFVMGVVAGDHHGVAVGLMLRDMVDDGTYNKLMSSYGATQIQFWDDYTGDIAVYYNPE